MLYEAIPSQFAYSQESISQPHFQNGNHTSTFNKYKLFSAFQPIFSVAHQRVVGLEGLVRAVDNEGNDVPPNHLFNETAKEDCDELDRICQEIHLKNFLAMDLDNVWIFLNVSPNTLSDTKSFSNHLLKLTQTHKLKPERIVLEVLESDICNEQKLETAILHYKQLGFLIAIDDFGIGHSNFHRIWRLGPDIVKFDRSMVQRAAYDRNIQRMMKGIVHLLHTNKCIVLAEGVENSDEAIACMDSNVDLVQGYYFCKPTPISESPDYNIALWGDLCYSFSKYAEKLRDKNSKFVNSYKNRFASISHILTLRPHQVTLDHYINTCALHMFSLDGVIRIYAIAENGQQSISNLTSPKHKPTNSSSLSPLAKAKGATWLSRQYFYNAMNSPGIVVVTEPYFSIPDAELCITLSVKIDIDNTPTVICCDILWDS